MSETTEQLTTLLRNSLEKNQQLLQANGQTFSKDRSVSATKSIHGQILQGPSGSTQKSIRGGGGSSSVRPSDNSPINGDPATVDLVTAGGNDKHKEIEEADHSDNEIDEEQHAVNSDDDKVL